MGDENKLPENVVKNNSKQPLWNRRDVLKLFVGFGAGVLATGLPIAPIDAQSSSGSPESSSVPVPEHNPQLFPELQIIQNEFEDHLHTMFEVLNQRIWDNTPIQTIKQRVLEVMEEKNHQNDISYSLKKRSTDGSEAEVSLEQGKNNNQSFNRILLSKEYSVGDPSSRILMKITIELDEDESGVSYSVYLLDNIDSEGNASCNETSMIDINWKVDVGSGGSVDILDQPVLSEQLRTNLMNEMLDGFKTKTLDPIRTFTSDRDMRMSPLYFRGMNDFIRIYNQNILTEGAVGIADVLMNAQSDYQIEPGQRGIGNFSIDRRLIVTEGMRDAQVSFRNELVNNDSLINGIKAKLISGENGMILNIDFKSSELVADDAAFGAINIQNVEFRLTAGESGSSKEQIVRFSIGTRLFEFNKRITNGVQQLSVKEIGTTFIYEGDLAFEFDRIFDRLRETDQINTIVEGRSQDQERLARRQDRFDALLVEIAAYEQKRAEVNLEEVRVAPFLMFTSENDREFLQAKFDLEAMPANESTESFLELYNGYTIVPQHYNSNYDAFGRLFGSSTGLDVDIHRAGYLGDSTSRVVLAEHRVGQGIRATFKSFAPDITSVRNLVDSTLITYQAYAFNRIFADKHGARILTTHPPAQNTTAVLPGPMESQVALYAPKNFYFAVKVAGDPNKHSLGSIDVQANNDSTSRPFGAIDTYPLSNYSTSQTINEIHTRMAEGMNAFRRLDVNSLVGAEDFLARYVGMTFAELTDLCLSVSGNNAFSSNFMDHRQHELMLKVMDFLFKNAGTAYAEALTTLIDIHAGAIQTNSLFTTTTTINITEEDVVGDVGAEVIWNGKSYYVDGKTANIVSQMYHNMDISVLNQMMPRLIELGYADQDNGFECSLNTLQLRINPGDSEQIAKLNQPIFTLKERLPGEEDAYRDVSNLKLGEMSADWGYVFQIVDKYGLARSITVHPIDKELQLGDVYNQMIAFFNQVGVRVVGCYVPDGNRPSIQTFNLTPFADSSAEESLGICLTTKTFESSQLSAQAFQDKLGQDTTFGPNSNNMYFVRTYETVRYKS